MPMLNEVSAWLAARPTPIVVTGIGNMPETPNVCIILYRYGGSPAQGGFGSPGIRDETPGLQVQVRGEPYDTAGPEALIETVYRAIAELQGLKIYGTQYKSIHAQQAPYPLSLDEHSRETWVVNFLVEKELSVS